MKTHDRINLDIWRWVSAVLYLLLAWQMATILISPGPEDGPTILTFVALLEFEFLLVHSAVFMAIMPKKVSLIIFVPFYGAFAFMMNRMIPGNMILWLYLIVILTRMRFAFSEPTPEAKGLNFVFSVVAISTYFILVMIFTLSAEYVPRFGLTVSYLHSVGYEGNLHIENFHAEDSRPAFGGLPHPALLTGAIYFTFLAIYELVIPKWAAGIEFPDKLLFNKND